MLKTEIPKIHEGEYRFCLILWKHEPVKDEAQACEIDDLVEKKFEGSLPTFIAAFTKRQDLSEQELDEVQQMIDRIRRGETQ